MIGGNDDKAIAAHLESTHDFADKILKSADEDPNDTFLKAVGILAQVIFATVHGEHREEILAVADDKLRNYLSLLDEVSGMGKMVARRALIGFRLIRSRKPLSSNGPRISLTGRHYRKRSAGWLS